MVYRVSDDIMAGLFVMFALLIKKSCMFYLMKLNYTWVNMDILYNVLVSKYVLALKYLCRIKQLSWQCTATCKWRKVRLWSDADGCESSWSVEKRYDLW